METFTSENAPRQDCELIKKRTHVFTGRTNTPPVTGTPTTYPASTQRKGSAVMTKIGKGFTK